MNKKLIFLEYLFLCFLISLLLSGILFLRKNAIVYYSILKPNFEISVFLKLNVSSPEIIFEKIRSFEEIKKVELITKDKIKDKLNHLKNEILLIDENPFPDCFIVVPQKIDSKTVQSIVSGLNKIDGIEEIKYDANLVKIIENLEVIIKFLKFVLLVCVSIIIVLFISAIVIKIDNINEIIDIMKQKYFYLKNAVGLAGFILSFILIEIFRVKFFERNIFMALSAKEIIIVFILTFLFNLWKIFKEG